MRFIIDTKTSVMSIDNAVAYNINTAGLSNTIYYVVWNSKNYIQPGQIQYYNSTAVRSSFSDPSPYQSYVNQWMNYTANVSPALSVSQAQMLKNDLISSIYDYKRQAPIGYGGNTWDASDRFVSAMTMSLSSTMAAMHRAELAQLYNLIGKSSDGDNTSINGCLTGIWGGDGQMVVSNTYLTSATWSVANVNWIPYNSNTVASVNIGGLVAAISTRQMSLMQNMATFTAAVNATVSVANVVAYDVTAGWSY